MWKVMAADDEPFIREGIEKLIPWKELGCELCYMACNGKELMEQIHIQKPDIVIADIRMPIMGGLDVARQIQEMRLNIKVILLTAYTEFQYAHAAIQYNVSDYIVKTSALLDIPKAIEKIVAELKESRLVSSRIVLFRGIPNEESSQKMIRTVFSEYEQMEFAEDLKEICVVISGNRACEEEQLIEDINKLKGMCLQFFQKQLIVGISDVYHDPKQIYEWYERLLVQVELSGSKFGPGIYRIEENDIVQQVNTDESSNLIRQTELFVSEHFCSKITLEDIAAAVHVNPSYLSRVYKQKKGNNLFDFINLKRIEKAKEYIENQNKKMYEIAELVGFEDITYFSKVFKKYEGISPKEYDRKHCRMKGEEQ